MKTKVKSSILRLLSLLLVLPIVFIATACAGTAQLDSEAKCNIQGEYSQAATVAEYNEVVANQNSVDSEGYRLTMNVKTKMMGFEADAYINAVFKNNEAAIKMIRPDTSSAESAEDIDANKKVTAYAYYKDGFVYADQDGEKVRYEAEIEKIFGGETTGGMSQFLDVEEILQLIRSNEDIEIFREGNNFKIVFGSIDATTAQEFAGFSDMVVYLNFDENDKLTAVNVSCKFSLGSDTIANTMLDDDSQDTTDDDIDISFDFSMSMDIDVTFSVFNGDIEFPDLSGYKLVEDK